MLISIGIGSELAVRLVREELKVRVRPIRGTPGSANVRDADLRPSKPACRAPCASVSEDARSSGAASRRLPPSGCCAVRLYADEPSSSRPASAATLPHRLGVFAFFD